MVSTMSALVAIVGLLQICPAPPLAIGLAGSVASGAVEAAMSSKRDLEVLARGFPPGVSQYSIQLCTTAINKQHANGGSVRVSVIDTGPILVTSVPPECMVLATVLSGNPAQEGGPVPIPMGVDSLQYTGVTAEDRRKLAEALGVLSICFEQAVCRGEGKHVEAKCYGITRLLAVTIVSLTSFQMA